MHALQATFAALVPALISQALLMGYEVTLGEAWRTPEQAQWNADHGVGIAHSLHIERLAIDLNLFKGGVFLTEASDYATLGEWWCRQHPAARWGGHFTTVDADHFSLTDGVHE